MKKIPTMFDRDWRGDRSLVTDQPNNACLWAFFGDGTPTRKIDGTCCMVRLGVLFKRREVRLVDERPADFERSELDETTGKEVGWVPVGVGPEDRWHREAFNNREDYWPDGTYELVGPKIQGNPEGYAQHTLVPHADLVINEEVPRKYNALREWIKDRGIEGIVFHHPDGRMAKIKKRDFGFKRG